MNTDGIIIIGAGHAGLNAAVALRAEKYTGPIRLLSEEADLPYHRPPLSKIFIKDDAMDPLRLLLRPETFYSAQHIDLQLNTRVRRIDTGSRSVELMSGERLVYQQLIMATGTRARPLPIEGIELKGVESLRTQEDARRSREQLTPAQQIVVIGGGFIGLELAAAAAGIGKAATVLEAAPRLLGRSIAPVTSDYVLGFHRQAGINIVLGASAAALQGDQGQVTGVTCHDGSFYKADLVVVGIGAIPNSELAEAAGLVCNDGIVVDNTMRTSDPAVFAIGDCAKHENAFAGGRSVRLESVQNANDQARIVAKVLTGDQGVAYNAVPWFWSDQGTMKLQMTGLSFDASEHVVRGDIAEGKFSVFHYRGAELIAVDSVNMPLDHMGSRKLLAAGVSPPVGLIQDVGVTLKDMIPLSSQKG